MFIGRQSGKDMGLKKLADKVLCHPHVRMIYRQDMMENEQDKGCRGADLTIADMVKRLPQ